MYGSHLLCKRGGGGCPLDELRMPLAQMEYIELFLHRTYLHVLMTCRYACNEQVSWLGPALCPATSTGGKHRFAHLIRLVVCLVQLTQELVATMEVVVVASESMSGDATT